MAKRRTKRKVSKTKKAAKRRAHGKSIYKVVGGWAVSSGRKRRKKSRRRKSSSRRYRIPGGWIV